LSTILVNSSHLRLHFRENQDVFSEFLLAGLWALWQDSALGGNQRSRSRTTRARQPQQGRSL